MVEADGTFLALATLVERYGIYISVHKLLVEDVKHFEKRSIGRDAVDIVSLEVTL